MTAAAPFPAPGVVVTSGNEADIADADADTPRRLYDEIEAELGPVSVLVQRLRWLHGVTADVVYPPVTETGWITDEVRSFEANDFEHHQIADPAEVPEVNGWLCADAGRIVTGNIIRLRQPGSGRRDSIQEHRAARIRAGALCSSQAGAERYPVGARPLLGRRRPGGLTIRIAGSHSLAIRSGQIASPRPSLGLARDSLCSNKA